MPATQPSRQAVDHGLFGPHSVTWRLHADPAMAFAGLRALLMQAIHPLAMAGVAQHSTFREDPWGRLARTGEYIGVTTFGTTEEARRMGALVRGIHRKVVGVEEESGTPYRASDPDLLLWVHCAQVDSVLAAMRASG
ncbi:MAG TPA: oxygenase MpaB family protein, partial [Mycobacteriales bacterium]|nr:oxygenase MpaB family protein [Mycobacteriales bacterium]